MILRLTACLFVAGCICWAIVDRADAAGNCVPRGDSITHRHAHALCKSLERDEVRETRPSRRWGARWSNVCFYEHESKSVCEWRITHTLRDRRGRVRARKPCRGEAVVTGRRHFRVRQLGFQCTSSTTAEGRR